MTKNDKELQGILGWKPHEAQKKVLEAFNKGLREIVICAGRRWGKSMFCAYLVLRMFLEGLAEGKGIRIWIVAPTYGLTEKIWEFFIPWILTLHPELRKHVRDRPNPQLFVDSNNWVRCKSADDPKSLLGEHLDLLIIDEAAFLAPRIWEAKLRATVVDRLGKTVFISTPQGKNWFYHKWVQNKEKGGSFEFPSIVNPYFPKAEWESLKGGEIAEEFFKMEYQATFAEGVGAVFRNIEACISPNCLKGPHSGCRYVMGLDLAKVKDYTVITIVNITTHEVVHLDRFQKIPYPQQTERIMTAAKRYGNAKIVIDSLNVGAAIADDLRFRGANVQEFKAVGTTSKDWLRPGTKEQGIVKLATAFEERNIHIPPEPVLIDEIKSYTYVRTDKGNISYGAPIGFHDDCVMSLMMANWLLHGKTRQEDVLAKKSMPKQVKRFQYK